MSEEPRPSPGMHYPSMKVPQPSDRLPVRLAVEADVESLAARVARLERLVMTLANAMGVNFDSPDAPDEVKQLRDQVRGAVKGGKT